jgi:hypothetical protein
MKRRLALSFSIAAAVAAFLVPAASASAATSPVKVTDLSPSVTTSRPASAGQFHAVAVNPNTGAQIAFYSANLGPGAYLATQRFDANGPVGSENVICDSAGGVCTDQTYWQYSVAYNPATKGWIAVYHDQQGDRIVGQLLNPDGSASGTPFTTVDGIEGPSYAGAKVVWNSASKKFLVTTTSLYDSLLRGRFVTGNGAASGSSFDILTGLSSGNPCPMDTAYSTQSNRFLAVAGGGCSPDSANRPIVQFLSGAGALQGSSRFMGSGTYGSYSASIAYNSKLDEFGVVWVNSIDSDTDNITLQRIDASNGSDVGSPIEISPPEGMLSGGSRVRVSYSPKSGNYFLSAYLEAGTSSNDEGAHSFQVSGVGETVTGSLVKLNEGLTNNASRPQNAYNPVSARFLTTYAASECEAIPMSATRSTRGPACTDVYNLYSLGAGTSGGGGSKKPTVKKAGTPGGTSARVKLGCGGSGKCTIKLTGKLKGGSGKIVAQTVEVKAGKKSKVKVRYSQALIDELAANGGGKIKLTARQVGGGSSTILLTVPNPVTG